MHFRIPFTMTSRVTELERPHRFVDEQVRGPFRSFHHEHIFEPFDNATLMIDRIRFDGAPRPDRTARRTWRARDLPAEAHRRRGEYLKAEAEHRSRAADPPR